MPVVKAKDGVELHCETHDYTDPWKPTPILILQHGFGRSSRFWYSMAPYIARHYRVVCPNLRGLGASPANFDVDRAITLENYVGDLVAIVENLGGGPVHYAGESLGELHGAARRPRRAGESSVETTIAIAATEQLWRLEAPDCRI